MKEKEKYGIDKKLTEKKKIFNKKNGHKDYVFKNNIKFYRKATGELSQKKVADSIGISRQHLNTIEKGSEPKGKLMLLIYMFFKRLLPDLKIEDLFWLEKKDNE